MKMLLLNKGELYRQLQWAAEETHRAAVAVPRGKTALFTRGVRKR